MWKIYRMTDEAWDNEMSWDDALAAGEIEVVEEFDTEEEALAAYDCYNPDRYGVTACDI